MPVMPVLDKNFSVYLSLFSSHFSASFASSLRSYAAYRNLPLISIGYRNDWAHAQWLTADPHDFVEFIAQSEGVATNFFHGCVFALKNAKPFVCETTSYRSNKVQGLMTKVGGEKHLVTENTSAAVYEQCLSKPLDELIAQKIEQLRQASNAYLDQAIGINQLQVA